MQDKAQALIVVTSHDRLGGTDRKTGFYHDEMALPYWALMDAGLDVHIASIEGGAAPHDPGSLGSSDGRPPAVARFLDDPGAVEKIQNTRRIDDIDPDRYSVVYLPGGHGTMWDFAESQALATVIGRAYDKGAVIGAVCHGPAGLVAALRADGKPLVEGLRVNSFTDAEEAAVGLTDVVPFLLESRLRELGGRFESAPNFQPKAVRDGRLVTARTPRRLRWSPQSSCARWQCFTSTRGRPSGAAGAAAFASEPPSPACKAHPGPPSGPVRKPADSPAVPAACN